MTVFSILQRKIQKDIGLELHSFRLTYGGISERKTGVWQWEAFDDNGEKYGSSYYPGDLISASIKLQISKEFRNEIGPT
jgi:hypothetical protein